ncbi:hypothetical protein CERZMDRAFT_84499 [Cercospora zeae-maydis SCOH1-5]|uniref:YDG domain-containing protein n=1 Tax=Cercospora zeae-maydis SCOH1-5 TaxID=717836 RepID=A0A6A6FHE3_9PEZI|nr:hypothetical protein CERZMDRAFT_84499 [Cercospora zeae-maydis SCOH1-5]
MSAHEANYADHERSLRSVIDEKSFIQYLKQEHNHVVVPLQTRSFAAGLAGNPGKANETASALLARLRALLDMLKDAPMTSDLCNNVEKVTFGKTLDIICTDAAFNDSACKEAAQELKNRYAQPFFGARDTVTVGPSKGTAKCAKYWHNGLTPGQTWPKSDAVREAGGHGPPQGGIYGHPLSGAFSITLKNGESGPGSLNRDEGIKLLYGTRGGASEEDKKTLPAPSRETYSLRASIRTKVPVRVFRFASESAKQVGLGPATGWRYDGLYKITGVQEAVNEKHGKFEQFTLERLSLRDNKGWSFDDCCSGTKSSDEEARKQTKERLETDEEVAAAKAERTLFEDLNEQPGSGGGNVPGEVAED